MEKYNIRTIVRVIRLMGRRKYIFLGAMFFFCGMEVFGAVLSTTGLRNIINGAGAGDVELFLSGLFRVIFGIVLWELYAPFCWFLRDLTAVKTMRDLKTDLCGHILRLPSKYHDSVARGELLSALSNDCACLEDFYGESFYELVRYAVDGAGGLVIMAVIDWRFAVVVFSLGMLSVFITSRFSLRLEKVGEEEQNRLAKTSTNAYELIQAAKTIRLFRLQRRKYTQMKEAAQAEADTKIEGGRISAKMNAAVMAINSAVYVAILLAGALFVHYGLSDWGTVIALMSLKSVADMLFVYCVQFMANMQKNLAGAKRLLRILDTEEEKVSECFKIRPQSTVASLKHVSFSYDKGVRVLDDFSMDIYDRKLTALVGESGSGKSTVMKILLALYIPEEGEVSFNGDLDPTLENLRAMTAYVPQDAMLVNGSIRDNITGGSEEISDEEIRKAVRQAGAEEFIEAMPDGYDSMIADGGKNLSGGQRQRLAIARALAKNSPLLLLDEVTSALDPKTAEQVTDTIREISREKAVLWITHDREIAGTADHVFTLSKPAALACSFRMVM